MRAKLMIGLMAVAFLAAVFASPMAFSKPEFAKKEGKPCTNCHVKTGEKELNDVGKCYKEKQSLAECSK